MSRKNTEIYFNFGKSENSSSEQDNGKARAELLVAQLHENWRKWSKTFMSRDDVRMDQEKLLWTKASSALRQLTDMRGGGDHEPEVLKKMVDFCVLMSGLGSVASQPVVKETYLALSSVMKTGDVTRFLQLPRESRKEHLLELTQVVMGIRLFNKDCRKGGAGIDDLPNVLPRASNATSSRLQEVFTSIKSLCSAYTIILHKLYGLNTRESEVNLQPFLVSGHDVSDVEEIKAALCLRRLQQNILCEISTELSSSDQHVKVCVEQLRKTLLQLHETVKYRSAVPTIQVYPLFVQLSLIWRELQYETASMSFLNRLIDMLCNSQEGVMEPSLAQFYMNSKTINLGEYAEPGPFTDQHGSTVKLKGYCPWTLIQTGGGLFPGVVISEGYAFRSPTAAENWFKDPDTNLVALQKVVSSHRYLILFFDLSWPIREDTPFEDENEERTLTEECGVQTELHPIPSYIDKGYVWSEWEMKRKAMQLAKLVKCSTKSQQTDQSAFRSDFKVQTIPQINKACGITKEVSTHASNDEMFVSAGVAKIYKK